MKTTKDLVLDYDTSREVYINISEENKDIVKVCKDNNIDYLELEGIFDYFGTKIEDCSNIYLANIHNIVARHKCVDTDKVFRIITEYISDTVITDILKKCEISQKTFYLVLEQYYGGKENIPNRNLLSKKRKKIDIPTKKEVVKKAVSNKKNRKNSLNKHQLSKKIKSTNKRLSAEFDRSNHYVKNHNDQDTCTSVVVEVPVNNDAEVVNYEDRCFGFASCDIYSDSLTEYKHNTIFNGAVKAGLIANRHFIPDIDDYVFDEINNETMFDFSYQEDKVRGFINSRFSDTDDRKLLIYCTGLQSALASVIKVCADMNVDLCLMQYNNTTDSYVPQVITGEWNIEKDPLGSIPSANIWLYDCTKEQVFSKLNELYCITLNTHAYDNTFTNGIFVLCTTIDKAFEAFSYFAKIMHTAKDNTYNNSVLLATCEIKNDEFAWTKNLAKSFNFKNFSNNNNSSEEE